MAHEDKRKPGTMWYHGTTKHFDGPFSLDKFGTGAFADARKTGYPAIYLSDERDHAAEYGEHIVTTEMKRAPAFKVNGKAELTKWAKDLGYKTAQAMIDKYFRGDIYDAMDGDAFFNRAIESARAAGNKLAIVDFGDLTMSKGAHRIKAGRVAIVLDPSLLQRHDNAEPA